MMPEPEFEYEGDIDDLDAFREARDSFVGRANPMDEKEPGIVERTRYYALQIFNAFLQTEDVNDAPIMGGTAGAVNWVKNGHWDHDFIWRASWKVVVSSILIRYIRYVGNADTSSCRWTATMLRTEPSMVLLFIPRREGLLPRLPSLQL